MPVCFEGESSSILGPYQPHKIDFLSHFRRWCNSPWRMTCWHRRTNRRWRPGALTNQRLLRDQTSTHTTWSPYPDVVFGFVSASVYLYLSLYMCVWGVFQDHRPMRGCYALDLHSTHPASTNPVTLLWLWIKREKNWQRNRTSASVYWSVHLQQSLRIRPSQNIWVCTIYTRFKDSHYDYDDLEHKS